MASNPGSKEAVDQGCTCPVMDNHHGAGIPFREKDGTTSVQFWINGECQLHGRKSESPLNSNT